MESQEAVNRARRNVLLGGALATIAPLEFATAQSIAQSQLVDTTDAMRMLVQRICKAYCQEGLNIMAKDAEALLATSITRFNRSLVSARDSNLANPTTVQAISKNWNEFKDLATASPSSAGFVKLDALAETLYSQSSELATQIATALKTQAAQVTNLCGLQRSYSQRMAKSAFALVWGIDRPTYARQYEAARRTYLAGYTQLRTSPLNTPAIAALLDKANIQLGFFENAVEFKTVLKGVSPARSQNMAKSNERLLEVYDELTGLYARAKV